MLELLMQPEAWIAFLTLTALELVLGIDNIIFISILVDRLPRHQRDLGRRIGLFLAMFMRIALLLVLSWIVGATAPLFAVLGHEISWRDIILIMGGLFLLWKSTREIHHLLEDHADEGKATVATTFTSVILQIILVDIVFSLDSIITAVGMAQALWVMVTAMVVAVLTMLVFADVVGGFVEKHPSVKVLALSFLLMIGTLLVADGLGTHVPKGYVYFSMAFSLSVELLNLRRATKAAAQRAAEKTSPAP